MRIWSIKQTIIGWCVCIAVMAVAVVIILFMTAQVWELGFQAQATARMTRAATAMSADGIVAASSIEYDTQAFGTYGIVGGDKNLTDALGDIAMFRLLFSYGFIILSLSLVFITFDHLYNGYFGHSFPQAVSLVFGYLLTAAGMITLAAVYYHSTLARAWEPWGFLMMIVGIGLLVLCKVMRAKGKWQRFRKRQLITMDYLK